MLSGRTEEGKKKQEKKYHEVRKSNQGSENNW
jgi:hypothetical protein